MDTKIQSMDWMFRTVWHKCNESKLDVALSYICHVTSETLKLVIWCMLTLLLARRVTIHNSRVWIPWAPRRSAGVSVFRRGHHHGSSLLRETGKYAVRSKGTPQITHLEPILASKHIQCTFTWLLSAAEPTDVQPLHTFRDIHTRFSIAASSSTLPWRSCNKRRTYCRW